MEKHLQRIYESKINFQISTDVADESIHCSLGNGKRFKHFEEVDSLNSASIWIIETTLLFYHQSLFTQYYNMIYNHYAKGHVDLNTMTTEFKLRMIDQYEKKNPSAWLNFWAENQ